jgi:hypothetical protein
MAEGFVLEFEGLGLEQYQRVSGLLGIDMETGEGDWPAGLRFHSGGAKPGGWFVFEVWDSQADQEAFMADRLGPALAEGGVDRPPTRAEWLDLASHHTLGG